MKHLPKHLRPRRRYLAVGIESWPDADVTRRAFQRELWYAAGNLLGDAGSADADLRVVRFEFGDGAGEAVVRTRHDEVGPARAAVACVDDVDGHPVGVYVRGVSGTVLSCEERYLGGRAGVTAERRVVFENDRRRGFVRDGAVDVELPEGFAGAAELDFESEST
ncbi:MAG: Rpp14/Pop5 family protein [Haloplanus sp.]